VLKNDVLSNLKYKDNRI